MEWSRREFLKIGSLLLSTACVDSKLARAQGGDPSMQAQSASGTLSILQTYTNENSAQFRVLVESGKKWSYRAQDVATGAAQNFTLLDRYVHPAWPDISVDHFEFDGLKLGVHYRLQVIETATGQVADERFFTSLDRQLKTSRTAQISCMCDDFPEVQKEMWQVVADQNPDVVFLVGDAVYLDGRNSSDEAGLWRRHLEGRRAFDLFRWKNLKPVISVWDDHDFGINDGGDDFPFKVATRQMFEAMFGSNEKEGFAKGTSLARTMGFAGQRFFLMDNRFYRTKNNPNGTHWGDQQEEWLFTELQKSSEPVILMSGSQFFGAYSGYESFEREHPIQFQRVLKRLSQQAAPVILVSGDRHFSELMKIEPQCLGYDSLEITTSSLHSYKPDSVPSAVNPRRFQATANYNFVMLESSASAGGLQVRVRSFGPGGKILMDHSQLIQKNH